MSSVGPTPKAAPEGASSEGVAPIPAGRAVSRRRRRVLTLIVLVVVISWALWLWRERQPRYTDGYLRVQDPGGRFQVELPTGYQFEITPGTGNNGMQFLHYEAFGDGAIDEFSVTVVTDYGRAYPADFSATEIAGGALEEMAGGYGGTLAQAGTLTRLSGPARCGRVDSMRGQQPVTVCMEAYVDGQDLVLLQTFSADPKSASDARGKHFFESFQFLQRKPRPLPPSPPAESNQLVPQP